MSDRLTEPQMRALREIDAGRRDDCTVMLPPGMVCLERGADGIATFPPKIVLTDRGREVLASAEEGTEPLPRRFDRQMEELRRQTGPCSEAADRLCSAMIPEDYSAQNTTAPEEG